MPLNANDFLNYWCGQLFPGSEVHSRFEMERGFPLFFDSVAKVGVSSTGFGIQIIGTQRGGKVADFHGFLDRELFVFGISF